MSWGPRAVEKKPLAVWLDCVMYVQAESKWWNKRSWNHSDSLTMPQVRKFTMPFEPMTIEHLGLRLYSTLPPVIAELVSNAYDAEASSVEVTLPHGQVTPQSEVVVCDHGHGMDADELQDEYLPIGRNRRGPDSKEVMSKTGKRTVTGRKGLGKLSAFGVASEVEVRSIKNDQAICLRLNYENMKKWAASHPKEPFEPEVVRQRTGKTRDKKGVEVILRKLRRTRPINEVDLRQGLARRLDFIGRGFKVQVNGTAVGPGDRVTRGQCRDGFSWDVDELPDTGRVSQDHQVRGWIGFLSQSSQIGRGISIFANRKAVELGSFFNYPSTHVQYARAYLVGEVQADFLDGEEDLAATARNSVIWESETGRKLQEWGQTAIKWAFDRWLDLRRTEKATVVIKAAGFDRWLARRSAREQGVANRMVKLLVDDPDLDPKSATPLLEIVKSSVETVAFRDLIDAIEQEGVTIKTLLSLFGEWRIIEAREHLKLADGRTAAIKQLEYFMKHGALEVQQIQPLFERHLWLIDSAWSEADGQTTYTDLLRKHCKEPKDTPEKDRRLDIFAVAKSGVVTVVELKRPEKVLSRSDLNQVEEYVDWARGNLIGSGRDAVTYVHGLLLVGKMNPKHGDKVVRLAGDDIRVQAYEDIRRRAREYYGHVERVLKDTAPEYARSLRKKRTAKATSPGKRKKKTTKKVPKQRKTVAKK
ncbi:MAG: ATP-binding protein [Phycisphaerae bacterium]